VITNDEPVDQAYYCAQLLEQLATETSNPSQLPLDSAVSTHDEIIQLYTYNCEALDLMDSTHYKAFVGSEDGAIAEAEDAALYFLAASLSDGEAILEKYSEYRSKIHSQSEASLHGKGFPISFLSNLPGTLSPVKAFPTYVQTPCTDSCVDGQSSILNLVWKLEVEMQDNWYEAYVDAFTPTRILKVLDWASDAKPKCSTRSSFAPIPKRPKQDKNGVTESTYHIWPWGINDPSEGKRDIVKSPYDVTASPIGWHSIPKGNNPSDNPFRIDKKDEVCDFTTTWGNNVQAQENWEGKNSWMNNYRPEGHDNLTFIFNYGASLPEHDNEVVPAKSYVDLVVTQLF
jgi:extracellular elastinolytic metalloproteinase